MKDITLCGAPLNRKSSLSLGGNQFREFFMELHQYWFAQGTVENNGQQILAGGYTDTLTVCAYFRLSSLV